MGNLPRDEVIAMMKIRNDIQVDGIQVYRLESDDLIVDVAPEVGGRIISFIEKNGGYEFLWRNRSLKLERLDIGAPYDPNFYGGIDELIPSDIIETVDGVEYPDHGELWTTALRASIEGDGLLLQGEFPRSGLRYERRMTLREGESFLDIDYKISNPTPHDRRFLWKMHAALKIAEGDEIDCPANTGQVIDRAWSRFGSTAPFPWPDIEGQKADRIPAKDGTADFFYLYDLRKGRMAWRRCSSDSDSEGLEFAYYFDVTVFSLCWLFASYGRLDDHYTAVLEPCTTMPLSVNEAIAKGRCTHLKAGESLETRVSIYAGPMGE